MSLKIPLDYLGRLVEKVLGGCYDKEEKDKKKKRIHVPITRVENVHWRMGVHFLLFLITATGLKMWFGEPIQCAIMAEIDKSGARSFWSSYIHDLCFVNGTFACPSHHITERPDRILTAVNYKYTPFFFLLLAAFHMLPSNVWTIWRKFLSLDAGAILNEMEGAKTEDDMEKTRVRTTDIAGFLYDHLNNVKESFFPNTFIISFCTVKFLMLIVDVISYYSILSFIGTTDSYWPLTRIYSWFNGTTPFISNSDEFPMTVCCEVEIHAMGNNRLSVMQCVLPVNMYSDKFFTILGVWYIMLTVLTVCSLVETIARCALGSWPSIGAALDKHDRTLFNEFRSEFLRADGRLMVQFVRNHIGTNAARDFELAMFARYKEKRETSAWIVSPAKNGFRSKLNSVDS